MNRALEILVVLAAAVLAGCGQELGPGGRIWVAGQDQEDLIGRAIADGTWVGLTKDQLEQVLRADVLPHRTINFAYGRPDTDLFAARFDEALVIHRPLKFDDVWILFRDGKVAHVAPIFIE